MIRIQNDRIPDEMSYSIICKHVNIGLRIHFLFFLSYFREGSSLWYDAYTEFQKVSDRYDSQRDTNG